MKNITTFETTHLIARKLAAEDFALLQQMHQNSQVMATLGGLRSEEETRKYLADNLSHWEQNSFGLWLLFAKTSRAFVGRAGLRKVIIEDNEEVEVAYALMPEYWHQGLATEIVNACIEIAFQQLRLKKIVCFTLPSNKASLRVMEKAGFLFDKEIIYANLSHKLYQLSNSDFWQRHIQFRPMDLKDLSLWQYWINKPHVKNVWFIEGYESADYINQKIKSNGYDYPYIIYLKNRPVGYIVACDLYAYRTLCPTPKGLFTQEKPGTFCMDLFIGEVEYINQGYGTQIVKLFVQKIFKEFSAKAILIDPAVTNKIAIRCYEKAGFKKQYQVFDGVTECQVMKIEK